MNRRIAGSVATAVFTVSLSLAGACLAAGPSTTTTASAAAGNPVEAHISALHKSLQITSAEESQWSDVAQTIRDNAAAHEQAVAEKRQAEATMTAPDDLRAYAQIEQTRAEGVQKLADSFDKLYATMPDSQKKVADTFFREHKHQAQQQAMQGHSSSNSTH